MNTVLIIIAVGLALELLHRVYVRRAANVRRAVPFVRYRHY
jgi:hypothetical protein